MSIIIPEIQSSVIDLVEQPLFRCRNGRRGHSRFWSDAKCRAASTGFMVIPRRTPILLCHNFHDRTRFEPRELADPVSGGDPFKQRNYDVFICFQRFDRVAADVFPAVYTRTRGIIITNCQR